MVTFQTTLEDDPSDWWRCFIGLAFLDAWLEAPDPGCAPFVQVTQFMSAVDKTVFVIGSGTYGNLAGGCVAGDAVVDIIRDT